jgi:hypothetical protein
MGKAASKKKAFTSKLDFNSRKNLMKCYIWIIALYDGETWTLWKVCQKYRGSFEMRCWRRMEKICWTNGVRKRRHITENKEKRNILHTAKRRKANWIGHMLCRNYLLKHVIEGRTEVTERRIRRRKQLPDDLKERRSSAN